MDLPPPAGSDSRRGKCVVLLMGVLSGGGALKLIRKLVRYAIPILRM